MCKALDDWEEEIREKSWQAGEKSGRATGERIGREAGERIGRVNGEKIGRESTLASLVKDGVLSLKDAADRAGISAETFQKTWILKDLS